MRVTLVIFAIFLITFFVTTHTASRDFNFGGWSGVIESFGKIDGVESENHDEISSKAEQALKKIIEKHLAGKKQAKQQARKKNAQPAQQPQQQIPIETSNSDQQKKLPRINELPKNINWDEHKETRDAINQKIPGGTDAVDALIKMLHENNSQ
ncbi:hypothetical protein PVAND_002622 [Polypedilum vanderplanki]|uniref:Uncharacterized protein n=1 Tax=Polypedilum vanderplanki TaxID=319348 RepID=A0A9J6BRY1_POLVA|nr:hypothetical protein PVAND_002622 [Polypedilum vanderplanki]